jgi:hypothetical protein
LLKLWEAVVEEGGLWFEGLVPMWVEEEGGLWFEGLVLLCACVRGMVLFLVLQSQFVVVAAGEIACQVSKAPTALHNFRGHREFLRRRPLSYNGAPESEAPCCGSDGFVAV